MAETAAFRTATKIIQRVLATFPADDAAIGNQVWRAGGCEALALWASVLRDIGVMTGNEVEARNAERLLQACRDLDAMIQEEVQICQRKRSANNA